ncbi:MAG: uroporphyrinogen decarboxylase family protein, partial [Pirellulaceae bacterium]
MNCRNRVKAALRFERPDRLPCHESPWEQTAAAWYKQGIPREMSLADFFEFDIAMMFLDPSPRFAMNVLGRSDGNITYEDRFGYTITKPEGVSSTMHFQRHVTSDQKAWEEIKSRFQMSDAPGEPARIDDTSYFGHFDPYPTWTEAADKYRAVYATDRYLLFVCYGPWEATWRHRGMKNLLMDVALEPEWVRDMAITYQSLVIDILQRCLDLGLKPDGILTCDDLGTSHGPLLSPQMWANLFKPQVARLGSFLEQNGIDFWMHSDGAIEPLIDHIVDAGVKVLNPLEAKAGMDVVQLRQRYGRLLAFYGNIDATKMGGPLEAIEAEIRRKVPVALEGGYV